MHLWWLVNGAQKIIEMFKWPVHLILCNVHILVQKMIYLQQSNFSAIGNFQYFHAEVASVHFRSHSQMFQIELNVKVVLQFRSIVLPLS